MSALTASTAPRPLSARFDYDPNGHTAGGLLGRWSVAIVAANGVEVGSMLAGHRRCMEYAKRHGVSPLAMRYTARARQYKPRRR